MFSQITFLFSIVERQFRVLFQKVVIAIIKCISNKMKNIF